MARADPDTEPLMTYRFGLREIVPAPVVTDVGITDGRALGESQALDLLYGFQSISIPDVQVQTTEITEGNWPFAHVIPITRATVGEITISQAVTRKSTDFYVWIHQTLYGRGAPRRDLGIVILGRGFRRVLHGALPEWVPSRELVLRGCIPTSWKPGSDLEASSSEVMIEELTLHVHSMELRRYRDGGLS